MFKHYSPRPTDATNLPCAAGSEGFSFELVATGDWQAITLTSECKIITISVRNDEVTYDHIDYPQEFHFTFNSDGSAWDYATRIKLDIGQTVDTIIGYVRAPLDYKIVVMGIY